MVTITLAHPSRSDRTVWQVFGTREDVDDRHVFGLKEFPEDRRDEAEAYAREMMEEHQADHLERLA